MDMHSLKCMYVCMNYYCMSHASHLLLRFCLPPVKQLCMGLNPLEVLLKFYKRSYHVFKNAKKPLNGRFLGNTLRLQTVQIDVL